MFYTHKCRTELLQKLFDIASSISEIRGYIQDLSVSLEQMRKINEDAIINKEVITRFISELQTVVQMAQLKDDCSAVEKAMIASKKKVGRPKKNA